MTTETLEQRVADLVHNRIGPLICSANESPQANMAPGGIVGVFIHGLQYYYAKGTITAGTKTMPTKDTIFGIGSVTKVLTTSVLGTFPDILDQPVRDYLPDGFNLKRTFAPVTFRQLATFCAGIGGNEPPGSPPTQQQFIDFINAFSTSSGQLPTPNVYSDVSIGLVGQALMHHAGYNEFGAANATDWLSKHLLDELGMNVTAGVPTPDSTHPLSDAFIYQPNDGAGTYASTDYDPWCPWGLAGRMYSTAEDMLKFVAANAGAATIDGNPVSNNIRHALSLAKSPMMLGQTPDPSKPSPNRQALAWIVFPPLNDGLTWVRGKAGGVTGVNSFVAVSPELGYGVVVLLNMYGVFPEKATIALMQDLLPLAMYQ